jgi:hypothetical protein
MNILHEKILFFALNSGANSRMTYKQLFKEIKILTLASLYILEVTRFVKIILLVCGAKTLMFISIIHKE